MSLARLQVGMIETVTSDMSCSNVQQAAADCGASLKVSAVHQTKTLDGTIPSQELLHRIMHPTLPTSHAEVIGKCRLYFSTRGLMLLNRLWPYMSAGAPECSIRSTSHVI